MNWKKCSKNSFHINLEEDNNRDFKDRQYPYLYQREYISEGYKASDCNSLIINFKIDKKTETHRIEHKCRADEEISKSFTDFFECATKTLNPLIIYPPCADKNRFDFIFEQMKKKGFSNYIKMKKKDNYKLHTNNIRNINYVKNKIEIEEKLIIFIIWNIRYFL